MTPPLLLIDNVFDTVGLYPNATLAASSEVAGREAFRVADYRRDRTWWQPTAAGDAYNYVDLGVGASRAVDFLFLDRGHNLWGKQINLNSSNNPGTGFDIGHFGYIVPAQGTVGGNPLTGFAVTEEGALYTLFPITVARRAWMVQIIGAGTHVLTGVMLGQRAQLLSYSAVYDEDAGERTQSDQTSRAGYRGAAMTYAWRTCDLDLRLIGATEYDTQVRELRRLLFEDHQPAVVFMNHVAYPARGWMYQLDGAAWAMPKTRVYRGGRIRLRELGAALP